PSSVRNPSVSAVAGEAIGDGVVNGTIGDETGEGITEGDGEIGSEPDVHSGEGGVYTSGAGGGYVSQTLVQIQNPVRPQTYSIPDPPLMLTLSVLTLHTQVLKARSQLSLQPKLPATDLQV
ncbi:hypothetical protein Tco_0102415, partial [Tanacetum coccineum]